jgi:hypothetical protein
MGVKGGWEIIYGFQGRFSRKALKRLRSMENWASKWELYRERSRDNVLFSVAKLWYRIFFYGT